MGTSVLRDSFTRCIASLLCLLPLTYATPTEVPQAIVGQKPVNIPVIDGTNVRFSNVAVNNGTSQISANQIVQDNQGFMWFGGFDGLVRYDGRSLKDFTHDPKNPGSLSGVSVHALFKDRDGVLWVGCQQFLNRFNPLTETFTRYPVPSVTHISQDATGKLWLSTPNGLFSLDPSKGIHRYRHDPEDPGRLHFSRAGIHPDRRLERARGVAKDRHPTPALGHLVVQNRLPNRDLDVAMVRSPSTVEAGSPAIQNAP